MLPLFVNLSGQRCLVVGGGSVGQRKARTLLNAGALVRLVCLEPCPPEFADMAELAWVTSPFQTGHVTDCRLVCAAATPEVNTQVIAAANAQGLWVNSASNPDQGNVTFPATFRAGPIHGAISTDGAAPMLARRLAAQCANACDDAWQAWVTCLAELRPLILANVAHEDERRALFQQLTDPMWLVRWRAEEAKVVQEAMRALVPVGLSR